MEVRRGEVVAVLGENGAGKSTLIKVIGGVYHPDQGTIFFDNKPVKISGPAQAQQMGIAIIHQELNLIPSLSVLDNLFLGKEKRLGWISKNQEASQANKILASLGINIDLKTACKRLSVAEQQLVEIAKGLLQDLSLLILDEPTTALSDRDANQLFGILKNLTDRGDGIIYISHRLEEVEKIADKLYFLRDGHHVGTKTKGSVDRNGMIELMVGRTLDQEFPEHVSAPGEIILEVNNFTLAGKVKNISFQARRGEILAITGQMGAGRTELVRLIAGADRPDQGDLKIKGKSITLRNPGEAIDHGIGMLPEDRKTQGLVQGMNLKDNFALVNYPSLSSRGWINDKKIFNRLRYYLDHMSIKATGPKQTTSTLSGGNQQKVVLAKWLERNCDVIIFDEPTRGIDVGAKYEIYQLMHRLVDEGKCILMVSSELPEVLGMADRILVMKQGAVVSELNNDKNLTQENILGLSI